MKKNIIFFAVLGVFFMMGCNKADKIQNGSKVKFHYTLTVDGAKADSSEGREPLSYEQGSSQIIKGLEAKMEGLKKGDKKTFTISPEDAYGVRDEKAMMKIPKTSVQNLKDIKVGSAVAFMQGERKFTAKVHEISKDTITLDYNHPMAGKTLTFDIEVVEIENPVKK